MAFRVIRDAVASMQSHLEAGYKKTAGGNAGIVLYGYTQPYPFSILWLDEFGAPALAGKLYSSAFPL